MAGRVGLLLATRKGLACVEALGPGAREQVAWVSTFRETGVSEPAGPAIREACAAAGIPHRPWKELRGAGPGDLGADAAFCVGWRYLLPDAWLEALAGGVWVVHDSLLPRYRGFAPVPTAMLQGEAEVGLTLLRAEPGIDAGPVLLQRRLVLDPAWYVQDVIDRLAPLYAEALLEFLERRARGELATQAQDAAAATYSCWRDDADCQVDWSRPAGEVLRLVRAVSRPYRGAWTTLGGARVTIWRAAPVAEDPVFELRYPGKVWRLGPAGPVVICGQGLLELTELEAEDPGLLPVRKLRTRFGPPGG